MTTMLMTDAPAQDTNNRNLMLNSFRRMMLGSCQIC